MNLLQLKERVMFQTDHSAEEAAEHLPHLRDYLNEGYDRLCMALYGKHVEEAGDFPPLSHDRSQPELPLWAHAPLADYACWMICRNGAPARQSRGLAFLKAFEDALSRARMEAAQGRRFRNLPR